MPLPRRIPLAILLACAPVTLLAQSPQTTGAPEPLRCTSFAKSDAALDACRRAAKAAPNSPVVQRAVGAQLAAHGDYKGAAKAFERAVKLDERSPEGHLGLGQAYDQLGRKKDAVREYRRFVALAPEEPRARQILGWILLEMRDAEGALASFREAIRLDRSLPAAHFGLAIALGDLGRHEEALRSYAEAARIDPSDADVWGRMAMSAILVRRPAEAVTYWDRALQAQPAYFDSRPGERQVWEDAVKLVKAAGNTTVGRAIDNEPNPPARRRSIFVGPTSSGSGFYVSRDGHVLTNKHVIRGCGSVRVRPDSGAALDADVVALDSDDDLALLRARSGARAAATFRAEPGIRPGDDVVAVGFPLAGLLADQVNVTVGTVNALAGLYNDKHMMQMSAPVQPGSSGGPLFDASGNVVGIVVTKLNAKIVAEETGDIPQNVNFAIKGTVARHFLDAQGIRYTTAPSAERRSNADVGDIGREVVVMVECLK
ncbi:MAG TPA: trypsin-like peptidase domain-containing protein [Gemmatimonadaceae bacterium]|nr:trypsin-like peptidase domain-containing protein [Gemmatimonadaceae bacterium]